MIFKQYISLVKVKQFFTLRRITKGHIHIAMSANQSDARDSSATAGVLLVSVGALLHPA